MKLTRKCVVLFFATIFTFALISCTEETTTETMTTTEITTEDVDNNIISVGENGSIIPRLSDPNGIFLSTEDYDITYQDLYDEVKSIHGLQQITNMVDLDLLSSYIEHITIEEVEARKLEMKYGTSNLDEIDLMTESRKSQLEISYEKDMVLAGYQKYEDEYISLIIAREQYSIDQMLSEENSDQDWYAGPSEIKYYYEHNYEVPVNAIKIKFSSKAEANSVLIDLGLVAYRQELRLYTGETPLEDMLSTQIDESNTQTLSDEEILEYYILMYNFVYGNYRENIADDSTFSDLLNNENLIYNYEDLHYGESQIGRLIYNTLGTYSDSISGLSSGTFYTSEILTDYYYSDPSYYLVLVLNNPEKVNLDDFEGSEEELKELIGAEVYDALQQEIIEMNLLPSSFVSNRLADLRQEHNFDVYDYYLGLDYQNRAEDFIINEDGHLTYLYTYDDVSITADEFLTEVLDLNLPLYLIYATQTKAVIASHYEDIYCNEGEEICDYDVLENDSEKMDVHRENYDNLKTQFEASYYVDYYTFDEYIYLAYGVRSEYEMMYEYYVKSSLRTLFIYDKIEEDCTGLLEMLLDYRQPFYDNYFSLDVKHILLYIDRNEDNIPDNYYEFVDELDSEELSVLNSLIADLEVAISEYEGSFTSLVKDYNNASREDETWGAFKNYGLYIVFENLGELTYDLTYDVFAEEFVEALIDLYEEYNNNQNIDEESLTSGLVTTQFGLHSIVVEKGLNFELPELSITPLEFAEFTEYKFSQIAYGAGDLEEIYGTLTSYIEPDKLAEMERYIGDIHNSLYSVEYLNVIIIEQLLEADYINSNSTYVSLSGIDFIEACNTYLDIYTRIVFE